MHSPAQRKALNRVGQHHPGPPGGAALCCLLHHDGLLGPLGSSYEISSPQFNAGSSLQPRLARLERSALNSGAPRIPETVSKGGSGLPPEVRAPWTQCVPEETRSKGCIPALPGFWMTCLATLLSLVSFHDIFPNDLQKLMLCMFSHILISFNDLFLSCFPSFSSFQNVIQISISIHLYCLKCAFDCYAHTIFS